MLTILKVICDIYVLGMFIYWYTYPFRKAYQIDKRERERNGGYGKNY